tara:strand:+ start:302 stop:1054 length:753 start_codon:yes stop_codon:yes gene_type:complete
MTISTSNTLTKEEILEKWNNSTLKGTGDYAYYPERKEIENIISSLLRVEYFNESVQKMRDSYLWDERKHQLTDEEKIELNLYREVFEWKENYLINSSWHIHAHCNSEDDKSYSLDDVKAIIESDYPSESLTEPEDESQYSWDSEMSHFRVEVLLGDLQVRKTTGDKLEEVKSKSEQTIGEINELRGIVYKLMEDLVIPLSDRKDEIQEYGDDLRKETYGKITTIFNKVSEIHDALKDLSKNNSSSEEEAN